jgi:hypothetical protein
MLASTIMFALLALAGFLVLRRHRLGAGLSVALQLVQVPMWSALGTSWMFTTGPYLGPMFTEAGLEPSIGLNLQWFAQVRGATGPAWAVINLVPFVVLLLLRTARPEASLSATYPGSPAAGTSQTPPVAPPA